MSTNAFVTGTAVASAVAPVAAVPTTAAHFCLFNGELAGGKSYYVTSCSCTSTTTAAAAENLQLLAHVSVAPLKVLPSSTAAQGPKSFGSGVNAGTRAQAGSSVTIVNDSVWHPVGGSSNSGAGTATVALGTWVNLINTIGQVLYVIPPGGMLSFACLQSTAAGKQCIFVTWVEQ